MDFVDIHSHLIPNVDDGSKSVNESVKEIKELIKQGVTTLFLTPHSFAFDFDNEYVMNQLCVLKDVLLKKNIYIDILLGCEMYCDYYSIDECIRKLNIGIYPTMNLTQYVLTEFNPYLYTVKEAIYCINRLIDSGYIPIIAHAERYGFMTLNNIVDIKDSGALIQTNAYSFVNETKISTKTKANELLREMLIDFIGSDTHCIGHRPPCVSDGINEIIKVCNDKYASEILFKNAEGKLYERD